MRIFYFHENDSTMCILFLWCSLGFEFGKVVVLKQIDTPSTLNEINIFFYST